MKTLHVTAHRPCYSPGTYPHLLLLLLLLLAVVPALACSTQAAAGTLEAALAELDMDHYDDSDEEAAAADIADDPDAPCPAVIARALGGRSAGIIVDDPYMAAAGGDSDDEEGAAGLEGMDSEEVDDYTLRDSDLLVLAARNEDDVSTLEVWVYEEASSSTGERRWGAGRCSGRRA
jgi:periodic tryptophan protein 1